MGCLKVFYVNREIILESDIVEQLYKMIKDTDPLVIINTIQVLNEILHEEGGISVSNKMIVYLLNRLKEFNESGQTVIIQLLNKHKVKTD